MTKTTKTPSQTPAAVAARARRAAAKAGDISKMSPLERIARYEAADAMEQPSAEDDATTTPPAGNEGVFSAMAASLTAEQAEAAEDAAIAALAKAKTSSSRKPASVRPADLTRYTVGAYKGRAGAMYEFMKRAGHLLDHFPSGYTREQMVESCTERAPHAAVSTRAQVLDYFAWAVRHGLLVEDTSPVVAVVAPKSSKAASKKAAQKKAKAGRGLSALLTGAFTA